MLYTRNGVIYLCLKNADKRLRFSTGLKDSPQARDFIEQNSRLFVENKPKALQEFYALKNANFTLDFKD
ncbi:hypothetical protein, partial [Campylobacter troglodytis]|uniref:hypothetical protein n=1 Tax=Campylobacter troglodytis TaxID=654363 RepID=UPI003D048AB6